MWIARDKDGVLCLHNTKPIRDEVYGSWFVAENRRECFHILKEFDRYPNLRWEDEPIYCTLRTNEELNEIRDKVFYDTKEHCEKYTIDLLAEYLSDEYGLGKTELEETIKQFYTEK